MEQTQKINIECEKCPKILGDTFCEYHKKQIWKKDLMCPDGYLFRIQKGADLIMNTTDFSKCEKIFEQMKILEKLFFEEKERRKEENDGHGEITPGIPAESEGETAESGQFTFETKGSTEGSTEGSNGETDTIRNQEDDIFKDVPF